MIRTNYHSLENKMNNKINTFIAVLKDSWITQSLDTLFKTKSLLEELVKDKVVLSSLQEKSTSLLNGSELYKDEKDGYILFAYSEQLGKYRLPHNHGNAWVVYAVVSGCVEMGNYINLVDTHNQSKLVLKNSEKLTAGDCRIYYPGEIHDTRTISETSIILRFTSSDLKVEEREGRMLRFQL